jgi:hypothetical protein
MRAIASVSPLFLAVFFFAVFLFYGGWALFRRPAS